MASYYYQNTDGDTEGPILREDLSALLSDGLITKDTPVSKENQGWKAARDYPELAPKAPTLIHPALMQKTAQKADGNPPSFGALVVLALLIWPLGLIGAIVYLCDPKHRGAGVALFLISISAALASWFLFFR